ncbi:uncharacterized protein TNCV_842011 [Trichonephila clavipes]|nr:uncharacterized protein TNCV_842011 [Trichonephila clavipes]
MIMKFEETGNLGVLPGRGRKSVGNETGEVVATVLWLKESPVPSFLLQVVDQLHASWRFRGRQFDFCVMPRHFPDAWPSRSPELNPCDFWLGRFLKDSIYSGGIKTLPDLKASIIRHVAEIPRELLRAIIENAIMRFQHVIDVNKAHTEHIL